MIETNVKQFSASWVSLIKDHAKLLSLESELAQISMFPLLISGLTMALFGLTLWSLIMISIGYGLYLLGYPIMICLISVIGMNMLGMMISYALVMRYKNRMSFERTRARLKEIL